MSFTTQSRNTLAALIRRHPDCVQPVAYGKKSTLGLMKRSISTAALQDGAERGHENQSIRVDTANLDRPGDGETISVGGKFCAVQNTQLDPTGVLLTIEYVIDRPVKAGVTAP